MKFLFPLFLSFSLSAFTPKEFILPAEVGGKAVFVDFLEADYSLNYDILKKQVHYTANIKFKQSANGKPVFDVVVKPQSILLNGSYITEVEVLTPDKETTVRVLDQDLKAGVYNLIIEGQILNLVKFETDGVSAAHWTSDLEDRSYLEQYLPTNLEYDQYKMTFQVSITGTNRPHRIYANGEVENLDNGLGFKISYPKYFTSSSSFYHLAPEENFKEVLLNFESKSGKNIPVTIYGREGTTNFETYSTNTLRTLTELENDYGSFPHASVVIYNNGRGGMEYCGATMTELRALEHELTHSYFARGIMPANGNAGWIDEAIASWRDNNYPRRSVLTGTTIMSAHPYYTRSTDRNAYGFGATFIAYLDGKIANNIDPAGMKTFLKFARENYLFTPYTVESFVSWMEQYYSYNFMTDFKKYTYKDEPRMTPTKKKWGQNLEFLNTEAIHQKMSIKELMYYL